MLPPAEFAHPMGRSGCRSCRIERDQTRAKREMRVSLLARDLHQPGSCSWISQTTLSVCSWRRTARSAGPGSIGRSQVPSARTAGGPSSGSRPPWCARLWRRAGPRGGRVRRVPALPAPAAALCAGTQRRRLRRHLARDRARAQVRRAPRAGAAAGRADARGRRRLCSRTRTPSCPCRWIPGGGSTGDSIRPTISPASWAGRSCGCCGGGGTGGHSPGCRPAGGAPTCADRLRSAAARPASAGRARRRSRAAASSSWWTT